MRAIYVRTWLVLLTLCASPWLQAAVTADMQKNIRANTFEVVAKKPELDPLTYEKPLPLDLIPFVQRNDPYQSIGTAFSLGRNTYVTASHVLAAAIDSQFGPPSLRTSNGKVFAIDRIHKFSAHEDFVVFSLDMDVAPTGLPVSRTPKIDDSVLAVGNALGDGVVIRDGLFTSETPEDQDGRWKWIRFSAAASPGNSGGPLLDTDGRVIGVVIAKSPNENLNFALPIGRVLDTAEEKASFDQRTLISLPFIRGTQTFSVKDEFKLPLNWTDFEKSYQTLIKRQNERARADLLKTYANSTFPNGAGTEAILYDVNTYYSPRVIVQQADLSWASLELNYTKTDLSGDGTLDVAPINGGAMIHLVRPNKASDDAFYSDSKAFMDIALRGLNLTRPVGSDQVRITSLGPALSETLHADRWGRKWQQRLWAVPLMDIYVSGFLLPTPNGYIACIAYSASGALSEVIARQQLLVNQVDLAYLGRIDQWHAFMQRRTLLPDALRDMKLQTGKEWKLSARRFELAAPAELIAINEKSELGVTMAFTKASGGATWDVAGAWWYHDDRRKAYLGTYRQPRPPESAKLELRNTFADMRNRRSPYNAQFDRDSSDTYEIYLPMEAPGSTASKVSSDLVYALTLRVEGTLPPTERGSFVGLTPQTLKILEHGNTEESVTSVPNVDAQTKETAKTAFEGFIHQIVATRSTVKDVRGRVIEDDLRQYLLPDFTQNFIDGTSRFSDKDQELIKAIVNYWDVAGALVSARDSWTTFLSRNQLDPLTQHNASVQQLEKDLFAAFAMQPSEEWSRLAKGLISGLFEESRSIAGHIASERKAQTTPRQSACPAPTTQTSGKSEPKTVFGSQSPDDFYPASRQRLGKQGYVVLELHIDPTGCATHAGVAVSSGDDEFDAAALRWSESVSFLPAEKDGKPVEATKQVAVNFSIQR